VPALRVELSLQALLDLEEIPDFIARDDLDAALSWIDRLVERAQRVGAVPRSGRIVREVGDPEIREVLLRTCRIIYRVEPRRVLVLTVIEGRRQLEITRLPSRKKSRTARKR
jgi:plasmid stabilization system protein ParE